MNNEIVYQVVKALPKEEQFLLFEKLKSDFYIENRLHKKRKEVLTSAQATQFLLETFFRKKNKIDLETTD